MEIVDVKIKEIRDYHHQLPGQSRMRADTDRRWQPPGLGMLDKRGIKAFRRPRRTIIRQKLM
jgi:hypothetical protein